MKVLHIILKVLLCLVLVIPVLGTLGVFPAPTADLYSPDGWAFMQAMMATGYMMPLIGVTCAATLILLIIGKDALAAVILAPFTVNVMLFHAFGDKNIFMVSSILGWALFLLNVYFLWANRKKYKALW